jgi:hypothetical protein
MKKFEINIYGYGAELTVGKLSEEQKTKMINLNEDLNDMIYNEDIIPNHYTEIDDIYHNYNVGDEFAISISDENGKEIHSIISEDVMYVEQPPIEVEYRDKYVLSEEPCLVTCSWEKGTFFSSTIEDEEFDIKKLKIVIDEECGLSNCFSYGNMISEIFYNGEKLYNNGGDTMGKSFDVKTNFLTES